VVSVRLFVVTAISRHVDKVVFAAKSHKKDQNVIDKLLSRFGGFANLCYYCIDKAFSFIEKHLVLEFSNTTKQMLFSFSFSPSCWFL